MFLRSLRPGGQPGNCVPEIFKNVFICSICNNNLQQVPSPWKYQLVATPARDEQTPPIAKFSNRLHIELAKFVLALRLNLEYISPQIIKEKDRFRKNPFNYAMRKTSLMKAKDMAESQGNSEEASRIATQLEELEERATTLDKQRQENIAGITWVSRDLACA